MKRSQRKYSVPQKKLPINLTKDNKIVVSKMDAARRQLETAIVLWFNEADPVSIHTLAMAAHEVLRPINRSRGGPPMLGDPGNGLRPEFEELFHDLMFADSHFFKHGSKDPDATKLFAPEINQTVLLFAVDAYHRIAHEQPPIFKVFMCYMNIHFPNLFPSGAVELDEQMRAWSKSRFFAEFLPVAASARFMPSAFSQQRTS